MAALEKYLPKTFVDAAETMSTEELRTTILTATEKIQEVKVTRDNDLEFTRAKENFNALKRGYDEVLKTHQAKINHSMEILALRGVGVSPETTK